MTLKVGLVPMETTHNYMKTRPMLCIGMVRPFENRILKSPVLGLLLYLTCDDASKSNHCPTVHSVILNIYNLCGSDYNFAAECRDRSQSCFLWSLKSKQEWIGNFIRNVNYASACQHFLLLCTFIWAIIQVMKFAKLVPYIAVWNP